MHCHIKLHEKLNKSFTINEKGETKMLFVDALVQLKAQVPVYRLGWEQQDGYLTLMPGMTHVWKIVLQPAPNAGNYIFSMDDLEADDWAPYQYPKKTVTVEETPVLEDQTEVAA